MIIRACNGGVHTLACTSLSIHGTPRRMQRRRKSCGKANTVFPALCGHHQSLFSCPFSSSSFSLPYGFRRSLLSKSKPRQSENLNSRYHRRMHALKSRSSEFPLAITGRKNVATFMFPLCNSSSLSFSLYSRHPPASRCFWENFI